MGSFDTGWANDRITALSIARGLAGKHVYPVHRLDRSASGVLVFALSSEMARSAQAELQAGRWHKEYVALVRGIASVCGAIDHPLAPEKHKRKKASLTHFELMDTFERYSLLRVFPQTGRRHQIRRHLRHISHPLIGDVKYGKAEHNRIFRERFDLHRLCLHATRLRFPHPETGAALEIAAPLPEDLAVPLTRMGFERW